METLRNLVKSPNSVLRSFSVTRSRIGVMEGGPWSPPECLVTFGRGGFILLDKIPGSIIELRKRQLQTFLDISLSDKLIRKSHRPQNKTFIRVKCSGVSDGILLLRTRKFKIQKLRSSR